MNYVAASPSSKIANDTNSSNSSSSRNNDTQSSGSLYDSALENLNLTAYTSFNESANNNSSSTNTSTSKISPMNSSTDFDSTLNGSSNDFNMSKSNSNIPIDLNTNINASMLLIQSESTDTNTSQEEVDPKSQLANKTIFKTDNPNLSIIEISENSIKEQDVENSVFLIESSTDDEKEDSINSKQKKSPNKSAAFASITTTTTTTTTTNTTADSAAEKRRKKAETLIHSSKQKLNVAIAEASAAETINNIARTNEPTSTSAATANNNESDTESNVNKTSHTNSVELQNAEVKREIKLYDTIEEFEQNLPSTVTMLNTQFGSKVYLVGTAHFSEESQDDVSYVIRNVRPDVVMVELCPSRIHILKLDEKTLLEEAKNFNLAKIRSIIQAHGYINGIFFILLLQMSAQIAKDLGMAPGGEFRRAFEEMHKLPGCMLHLGDRPIRVTLHRALRALSLWQTLKLVWRLTSTDTISIEEVEECKQRDLLEKLMQEMAGEFPAFSDVFVKERDLYLCHSLQLAAQLQVPNGGSSEPRPVRVVGVVGIGHANGIAQMWGRVDSQEIPAILEIPPASRSTRICKYTIKYGLIGLTLFGAFKILRPRLTRLF